MTRDEVLAMVMQADKDGEFTKHVKLWDSATFDFVGRIISISFDAGRKAAEQDRVDAERYRKRTVVGWIRGTQFIGLPEHALPTDKPVFDLEIDRARSDK